MTHTEVRPLNDPQIDQVLVLSTSHLPFEDSRCLDEREPAVMVAQFPYGWIVCVDTLLAEGSFLSPTFQRILKYAKEHECSWIRFDTDAPLIKGLPIFEWGKINVLHAVFKQLYKATLPSAIGGSDISLEVIRKIALDGLTELGYTRSSDLEMCMKCGSEVCDGSCS